MIFSNRPKFFSWVASEQAMWHVMLSSMFRTDETIITTRIARNPYKSNETALLLILFAVSMGCNMSRVSFAKCHIARSQLNCLLMSRFDWVYFVVVVVFFVFVREITLEYREIHTKCSFVCFSKVILYYIQSFCYFYSLFLVVYLPVQSTIHVLFNTNTYKL